MSKTKILIGLTLLASSSAPWAGGEKVVGAWQSLSGGEQLIFKPNGYLRTCFTTKKRGSAAMGSWRETAPGKYRIEFTHAISSPCNTEPNVLYTYQVKIVGSALATPTEVALFVSGEGPPDRYARTEIVARH